MILLKATTETLQITTSSTANVDYSVSYIDTTATTSLPSSLESKLAAAATVTLLAAPGASTKRLVKLITIVNRHASASSVVTIQKYILAVGYQLASPTTLLAGEMLQYVDGAGWRYYAINGVCKADQRASASSSSGSQIQYNNNGFLGGAAIVEEFRPRTDSGARGWGYVASSADSTKLVAAAVADYIYTSTDSGATWVQRTTAGVGAWRGVASSADGTKLVAVRNGEYIYTSADSGVTWVQRTTAGSLDWYGVASSADGTKLVAGDQLPGYLYTSTDSGATWVQRTSAGSRFWYDIASSSDGVKLVAITQIGYIYTSADSGVTWVQQTNAGSRGWWGIASSSDGTKLVAIEYGGYIYTSTDSGATWTAQTSAGQKNWRAAASSADGTKLLASEDLGYIYTSTDSGATWTAQTSAGQKNWRAAASSADGTKLVAGDYSGYIYTSPNIGLAWHSTTGELALTSIDTILLMKGITTEPVAPIAGTAQIYTKAIAGKMQLKIKGSSGLDTPLQAALWQNNTVLWTPGIGAGFYQGTVGISTTGVVVLPTTTNLYTMMRRSTFASAVTTANQQVGIRTEPMFTRGNMNGMGGFLFVCRFGFTSIKTGMRAFVGLCASTTIVSVNPSSTVNICGFGFDLADSAWSFMHNDGTGTATKEVIGGQGTLATNDTGYDAYIWWSPNRSEVYYRLDRTDTGATLIDGSVSTDLPVSTVTLMATAQMSNGTANIVANDAVLGINRLYVETDR